VNIKAETLLKRFAFGCISTEALIIGGAYRMSDLSMSTRDDKGVTVVDLAGKIALGETSQQLHSELRSLVDAGNKNILINLANVKMIDSSGLGTLVAGYTTVERAGGQLKLTSLSDKASELMTITKLYTVFEVFDDERAAVNSFSSGGQAAG
jgi:anti-sigma B factor antagonist